MAVNYVLVLFAAASFFIVFGTGDAYLSCYHCKPGDEQNCTNPNETIVKEKPCHENIHSFRSGYDSNEKLEDALPRIPMCFSVYIISKDNQSETGIYRNCYLATNVEKACDEIEDIHGDLHENWELKNCRACLGEHCNKDIINASSKLIQNTIVNGFLLAILFVFLF